MRAEGRLNTVCGGICVCGRGEYVCCIRVEHMLHQCSGGGGEVCLLSQRGCACADALSGTGAPVQYGTGRSISTYTPNWAQQHILVVAPAASVPWSCDRRACALTLPTPAPVVSVLPLLHLLRLRLLCPPHPSQNTRDVIMREFRSGSSRVLITTDLLARGIDVQQVRQGAAGCVGVLDLGSGWGGLGVGVRGDQHRPTDAQSTGLRTWGAWVHGSPPMAQLSQSGARKGHKNRC